MATSFLHLLLTQAGLIDELIRMLIKPKHKQGTNVSRGRLVLIRPEAFRLNLGRCLDIMKDRRRSRAIEVDR